LKTGFNIDGRNTTTDSRQADSEVILPVDPNLIEVPPTAITGQDYKLQIQFVIDYLG
jgi:hypothetical protein